MQRVAYAETHPAACATGVTCRVCGEEVVRMTFTESGDFGSCACSWTLWRFERAADPNDMRAGMGRVWRSTPRGFDPKRHFRPETAT